ncbi:MAG: hypothetical protein HOL74_05760 [Flavobacteriales bacterium]|nr:hypothetical protein [Flavobacteriales bacterium]MBT6965886.1 hypothetical protein [Flavobacteriales bacterium]
MTKKLLLLFITLTTFMNVSYASFPVTETHQTELIESSNSLSITYSSGTSVWGILSFSCALLSLFLIPNVIAISIVSLLGVIFGAIGFNKKLKGLAITGFILSLIFLLISFLVIGIVVLFGNMH